MVVFCQHDEGKDMEELRWEIIRHVIIPALRDLHPDPKTEVFINPPGRFVLGGFDANTGLTKKCIVSLAYAIGRAEPVAVGIGTHQTGEYLGTVLEQAVRAVVGLTPGEMIRTLGLDRPVFAQHCNCGHFTHHDAPWEQTDKATVMLDACQTTAAGVFCR